MTKCKWEQNEVCVNASCPLRADFCPVSDTPGVCRFEDRGQAERKNPICWDCAYCPISDFPDKHGRLVDADALAESVKQAIGTRGCEEWILDLIEEAEIIVEAREVSDNG